MVFKRVQLDLEAEPPGKNLFTPWAQKLPSHAGTARVLVCVSCLEEMLLMKNCLRKKQIPVMEMKNLQT